MICTTALVVALSLHPPPRTLTGQPPRLSPHRICLPTRYAKGLASGRFVVVVDGRPVAISTTKVPR